MTATDSPAVLRRYIAFELKRLREARGCTQAQVASYMRCAQSRITHIESQRNLPRLEFLEKLLRYYDCTEDQVRHFGGLLERANTKSWWTGIDHSREPLQFDLYLGLEDGASRIESYDPLLIPGLLQTPRYTEAIVRAGQQTEHDLDRQVDLRVRRQSALTRPDSPTHLWAVIDEQALDRPVAEPAVMREQLDKLLDTAELANVTLQICPVAVGGHPALTGPFTILHFPMPHDPGVVYIETRIKGFWFEEQPEIDQYTQIMNHLRTIAASPEQSKKLLNDKREEHI
ncbi:helix-turn-helix domain-containing protein [Actinopolyspora saharensis]|uniref:Helix-turn-helix domain-containing protein n=1 Tax=Actinopolyspora saharensis TaxID=995062 RepID=A0A1H1FI69_9ACTN|nr:helix-turn-helix transcriptional regulator [Actinopolyspora saharensis]SDR00560.1 Helix-turn-helix domain-containing protein [Actinopolyspora saharensis]